MLCLAYALINFVLPVKHAHVKIFIFASHSQTETFILLIIHYKRKKGRFGHSFWLNSKTGS